MGHRLLIVDDSAMTRAVIRRTISLSGVEADAVLDAPDGHAALAALAAHPVDLVLTDLNMPGMDGAELVGRIRADRRLDAVRVLVISADPNTERLEGLRRSGAAGYLRKPFSPEQLRGALEQLIGAPHV